jgi:hypothetical protein
MRNVMIASGIPATQADGLLRYFDAAKSGKIYPPTWTMQELLGRPPRTFGDWVNDHVDALRGRSDRKLGLGQSADVPA